MAFAQRRAGLLLISETPGEFWAPTKAGAYMWITVRKHFKWMPTMDCQIYLCWKHMLKCSWSYWHWACEVNRVFKHSRTEDFGLLRAQSHTATEVTNSPQRLKDRFSLFFLFLPSFYSPSCCFTRYSPSPLHLIRFSAWLTPRKIPSGCFANRTIPYTLFSQVMFCHFI